MDAWNGATGPFRCLFMYKARKGEARIARG